jgi:hypothetical protein
VIFPFDVAIEGGKGDEPVHAFLFLIIPTYLPVQTSSIFAYGVRLGVTPHYVSGARYMLDMYRRY